MRGIKILLSNVKKPQKQNWHKAVSMALHGYNFHLSQSSLQWNCLLLREGILRFYFVLLNFPSKTFSNFLYSLLPHWCFIVFNKTLHFRCIVRPNNSFVKNSNYHMTRKSQNEVGTWFYFPFHHKYFVLLWGGVHQIFCWRNCVYKHKEKKGRRGFLYGGKNCLGYKDQFSDFITTLT